MQTGSLLSLQQQPSDILTYEPFFGLKEKPFSLNSDPRFLYHSPSHAAAYENLLAGIRRREGLLVLTGEIGTGKTTLCRAVLRNLGRKTFSSFVPDPFASREDLLKMLLVDFGVVSIDELTAGRYKQASRTELSYLLSGFLESLAPLDAFVVVIIDEAQNMSLPMIEEVRILSDAFGHKGHLQIVFVGQDELQDKLKLPQMRQVDQRVCGYNRLSPLSRDAVAGYIQHRLHVAGGSRDRVLFAPALIDIIHRRSGGVPRLVNRICDRALDHAHRRQAASVDRETLETALIDIGPVTLSPTWASIVAGTPMSSSASSPSTASPSPANIERVASSTLEETPDNFSKRVDEWLTHDLAPTARNPATGLVEETSESPTRRPATRREHVVRRAAPPVSRWRDLDGELRGETYMQRLARLWTRRLAMAAAGFIALNFAAFGLSSVPNTLMSMSAPAPQAPAAFPALPAQPTFTVAGIAPPAASPVDVPQPVFAGTYFVAVGLFADRGHADGLVHDLTLAGLRADQRPFQMRRREVRQVLLGPFETRPEAVEQLQRLRARGGHDDATVIEIERGGA